MNILRYRILHGILIDFFTNTLFFKIIFYHVLCFCPDDDAVIGVEAGNAFWDGLCHYDRGRRGPHGAGRCNCHAQSV